MANEELVTIGIIALLIGLGVATYLELKYMRKGMKARRVRAAKRQDDVPDGAHNALVTTKAIASALARGGVWSDEVDGMIDEAQRAYGRHNYRVVLDITSKAKEKLTALKARHAADGDLTKVATIPGGAEEPTTKERLQKDFPPNLTQAKFTIELAESTITEGRGAGRDVGQAEQILGVARAQFEGKDYTAALVSARQAHRSAQGQPVDWTPGAVPAAQASATVEAAASEANACASCGTPLAADDAFCRKCGTKIGPRSCGSCGATVASDDAFCRKCGARVA